MELEVINGVEGKKLERESLFKSIIFMGRENSFNPEINREGVKERFKIFQKEGNFSETRIMFNDRSRGNGLDYRSSKQGVSVDWPMLKDLNALDSSAYNLSLVVFGVEGGDSHGLERRRTEDGDFEWRYSEGSGVEFALAGDLPKVTVGSGVNILIKNSKVESGIEEVKIPIVEKISIINTGKDWSEGQSSVGEGSGGESSQIEMSAEEKRYRELLGRSPKLSDNFRHNVFCQGDFGSFIDHESNELGAFVDLDELGEINSYKDSKVRMDIIWFSTKSGSSYTVMQFEDKVKRTYLWKISKGDVYPRYGVIHSKSPKITVGQSFIFFEERFYSDNGELHSKGEKYTSEVVNIKVRENNNEVGGEPPKYDDVGGRGGEGWS